MEDVLIVVSIQNYYGHELKEIMLDNDEVCDLGVIILPDGSCKNSYFQNYIKLFKDRLFTYNL